MWMTTANRRSFFESMPRPKDCEFTKEVVIEALKRADFKCERCGIPKEETFEGYLEIHHILGIARAVNLYPEISHLLISSLANSRVLCIKCHQIEDNEAKYNHREMADRLKNTNRVKYLITQRRVSRIA